MSDDKLVCVNTLCVCLRVCLRAGIYVCVYTGKGAPCLMTNLCVVILCVCVCLRAGIYVCVYTGKGAPCLMTNLCVLILCVCLCVCVLAFMCVSILGRVPHV